MSASVPVVVVAPDHAEADAPADHPPDGTSRVTVWGDGQLTDVGGDGPVLVGGRRARRHRGGRRRDERWRGRHGRVYRDVRGTGVEEERGALVAVQVVAGAHQVVDGAHEALGHLVQVLLVARDVLVDHAQVPRQGPLLGWKLVWSWLHTNE